MKLIDKAAVVAEIERRIKINKCCMLGLRNLDYYQGKVDALSDTISLLDTLEVKEVNLDGEINLWVRNLHRVPNFEELNKFARHFFELGLKAQKGK